MGDESGRAVVRPVRQQAGLPNWWKVCFVHGDQTKYYRKLYGRKSQVRSLALVTSPEASLRSSEADQDSM